MMATVTKPVKRAAYETWDAADQALKRLGQIEREIRKSENALNARVEQLRSIHKDLCDPLLAERKRIEKDLEKYCQARRADFNGTQSKALTFGVVKFRATEKLVIHNNAATLEAIKKILGRSGDQYIRRREDPDKQAMSSLPDETLLSIGVVRKTGEEWGYDINWESIVE
jgi:phage host-nuclease inhibitor protein Gam